MKTNRLTRQQKKAQKGSSLEDHLQTRRHHAPEEIAHRPKNSYNRKAFKSPKSWAEDEEDFALYR